MVKISEHTDYCENNVRSDFSRLILGRATVSAGVAEFDIDDEKRDVCREHVHSALTGSWEVATAVFVPRDLRLGLTLGLALQFCCAAGFESQILGALQKHRSDCKNRLLLAPFFRWLVVMTY